MKKFLTCAFIVLVLCFTGCSSSSFDWNEIYLNDMLPAPESNKGEINFNTESELMLSVTGISEAQYYDYKQACQDRGFIIDSEETLIDYKAYNSDGYMLDLFYNDSERELSIQLQKPMSMEELKWPTQGIASILPVPKSTVGKIEWESSNNCLIYVGEMSMEDYNAYVNECVAVGFNIDYDKGDTYYRADNAEGYSLSLEYEGFNTVFIRIDEPDEISSEISDTENPSVSSESKEPINSVPDSDVDLTVTFDEIYYAYEENELRADDAYKNNRYRITAKISGMKTDGVFNLTGGATLTMETRIDSTIVFFTAEFERGQEEALKAVNVGDTITFEGECLSAGTWVDCEIVTE